MTARSGRRARERKTGRRVGQAIAGPYRNADGVTNEDALAALVEVLGGPPERGGLYRVGMRQSDGTGSTNQVQFIGEYLGLGVTIVRETLDEIELSNGIVVVTLPCHAASARGMAVAVAILDEAAWWTGTDGSHHSSVAGRRSGSRAANALTGVQIR